MQELRSRRKTGFDFDEIETLLHVCLLEPSSSHKLEWKWDFFVSSLLE